MALPYLTILSVRRAGWLFLTMRCAGMVLCAKGKEQHYEEVQINRRSCGNRIHGRSHGRAQRHEHGWRQRGTPPPPSSPPWMVDASTPAAATLLVGPAASSSAASLLAPAQTLLVAWLSWNVVQEYGKLIAF